MDDVVVGSSFIDVLSSMSVLADTLECSISSFAVSVRILEFKVRSSFGGLDEPLWRCLCASPPAAPRRRRGSVHNPSLWKYTLVHRVVPDREVLPPRARRLEVVPHGRLRGHRVVVLRELEVLHGHHHWRLDRHDRRGRPGECTSKTRVTKNPNGIKR